jgi:hypothetical protein
MFGGNQDRRAYAAPLARVCMALLGGRMERSIALLLLALLIIPARAAAPDDPNPPPKQPKAEVGLLVHSPAAQQGYTLLAPMNSNNTYLIDLQGRVVRTWESDCNPGAVAYLLENSNLLRAGQMRNPPFFGGGAGGRIQEMTWDGKMVWDFQYSSATQLPHHDVCKLPNGNVLLIVWEKKPAKTAVAAGRRPETVGDNDLMADAIFEVHPTGKTTGKIVWEWHVWDHLIQDFDEAKPNYGDVGAHPELIDLNFGEGTIAAMVAKPEELAKLRAIGYVGAAGRKPQRVQPDWTHINSVDYNTELDQILLSVHEFSEVWLIDHSTTTAEAAGHKGGRYGKGGDLLYRWGNPRAHRAGALKDQKLFGQHDCHWIGKGLPGEGHILIFNNGTRRVGGAHSTVDEIAPPVDSRGQYTLTPGKAAEPERPLWSYVAPKRTDFFAGLISGAQRLPNGNTLICSGPNGTIFETTPTKEIVWKYVNPIKGAMGMGGPPFGGPPRLGQVLPGFLQGALNFTAEQKKQLEALEKGIGGKLEALLTGEQKKQYTDRPVTFGPGMFRELPAPGQLLAVAVQERLKLNEDQKKQLGELQKEVDGGLEKLLEDKQKKQLKEMQERMKGMMAGPPPGGGPPGGGPPGGAAPFGPGGFGGPGGSLFRAYRYASDYPGLKGKELTPGKKLEELQPKGPPAPPKDK